MSAAAAAQRAFQEWGWRKVARARGPDPGSLSADVLLVPASEGSLSIPSIPR